MKRLETAKPCWLGRWPIGGCSVLQQIEIASALIRIGPENSVSHMSLRALTNWDKTEKAQSNESMRWQA